ncbi:4'-phosphopantetheinyl transferase superfamily protein [uncultured Psychroserpens sp.]|uniref:4'-phosphopantetheinyl transferase family protein n=1 Tax=uncultured Psychroserpens sp. TaxID=255436 RepID=UPI00261D1FC2|nr:4'-phosphopantetheinyl transferase superfamily protein [uncultured Psychroserpens sp.]
MIGNDIVDLKHSAPNWKRPRFLEKVFTKKEQSFILSSENQHQMVWLLWSMKEAAYKAHVQHFENRFFNPKRLECELISEENGLVIIDTIKYYTSSTITPEYVYTVAKQNNIQVLHTTLFTSEISNQSLQSAKLKERALKSISETKHLNLKTLEIRKTKIGIPKLFYASEKLAMHLSLTHCGRFSGFVF